MKGTVRMDFFTPGNERNCPGGSVYSRLRYELNCPDGFFLVHIMKDTVQVEVLSPNNEKYCPGGCVYSR